MHLHVVILTWNPWRLLRGRKWLLRSVQSEHTLGLFSSENLNSQHSISVTFNRAQRHLLEEDPWIGLKHSYAVYFFSACQLPLHCLWKSGCFDNLLRKWYNRKTGAKLLLYCYFVEKTYGINIRRGQDISHHRFPCRVPPFHSSSSFLIYLQMNVKIQPSVLPVEFLDSGPVCL